MSELLGPLTGQLVGQRDDATGSVLLTGWSSGPAGLATIAVGAGQVELSLDYAEPDTVSQIVVLAASADASDPDRPVVADGPATAALEVLLGVGWATTSGRLTNEPTVVWRDDAPTYRLGGDRLVRTLGRLAVLDAEAKEHVRSPVRSAVADLERAVLAADLPDALQLAEHPRALAEHGGGALLDVGWAAIDERVGWRGRLELAALVARGITLLDPDDPTSLADRLGKLGSLLRGDPSSAPAVAGRGGAMPAPLPAAAAAPAGAVYESAQERVPFDVADDGATDRSGWLRRKKAGPARPTIRVEQDPAIDVDLVQVAVADDHLEVVVRPADDRELWLRLFRTGREPVLLEMAPVRRNDFGSGRATVLVPRGEDPGALAADLTDDPRQRWSPPAVRSTRRAVREGRDACRAERLGEVETAHDSWRRSAAGWDAVGDERRATLARLYAERGAPTPPGPPARRGGTSARREPASPYVLDGVEP